MIDWNAKQTEPPPLPNGMTFEQMQARAREEGIFAELTFTTAQARRLGVDHALKDTSLPAWAQEVVRSQVAETA